MQALRKTKAHHTYDFILNTHPIIGNKTCCNCSSRCGGVLSRETARTLRRRLKWPLTCQRRAASAPRVIVRSATRRPCHTQTNMHTLIPLTSQESHKHFSQGRAAERHLSDYRQQEGVIFFCVVVVGGWGGWGWVVAGLFEGEVERSRRIRWVP